MAGGHPSIIQQLNDCNSEMDLYESVSDYTASLGYDYFSVLKSPEDYHHKLNDLVLTSNWPASVLQSYDASGLLRESPIANQSKEKDKPFLWTAKDMYNSRREPHNSAGEKIFSVSRMSHGVGFMLDNGGDASGFVIYTGGKDLKNDKAFADIQDVSSVVFTNIVRLYQNRPKPESKLSKREQECLLWTSEGKTSYEIGMILGLSENTINNYLVTVGRKLGAVNRPHMVGIALRRGFI